ALGGAVTLAAVALSLPARADPPSEPAAPFSYGAQQFALLVGGGFGLPVESNLDVDHTRMFGVFPRWSIGLTDPLARGEFYAGNEYPNWGINALMLRFGITTFAEPILPTRGAGRSQ